MDEKHAEDRDTPDTVELGPVSEPSHPAIVSGVSNLDA